MRAPREWLTYRICRDYEVRAKKMEYLESHELVKARNRLIAELKHRCSVTELEAVNILRGANIFDYIRKYEIQKSKYMDILINGEKPRKKSRRKKPLRPTQDPNQISINTSQNASGQ